MKILQICQSYPPMVSGAARIAAELAEGLTEAGHEVLVIAASDRSEGGYGEENGRLRIERLPSHHNPARVGQRYLLWPQRAISEWVAAFQPDVIHLHEPLTLALCALRAANRQQIPVLLPLHQLPWFVSKYRPTFWVNPISIEWLLWRYGSWLLRHCAATIAPTQQAVSSIWQQTGCCAHVIPYGTDLRRFQVGPLSGAEAKRLRMKLGLSAEKPIILHVGRLDMDKDVHFVMAAAASVMEQVDAELLMVGDGRQRQALEKLCAVLGIADRCHFTGFIAHDEGLPDIYRLANVFITASEIETFGLVLLEAMASACPVVAVKTPCVAETARDRECGFLVQPRDVIALAEKVVWLLRNPQAAGQMGLAGQAISRRFNKEAMIEAHAQLYHTALRIVPAPLTDFSL